MRRTWTREQIIRLILEREAAGRSLTTGDKGVDPQLASAARRTFGSWRNAILAAGIPPERVLLWERWSPAKILAQIRAIARRRKPLSMVQVKHRFHSLLSAARRRFGSWSKAAVAAGVDPSRFHRVVPWNRERVIEAILTRELRNEPLVARLVEPRSLVEAAHRFLGSWSGALTAAGLDPKVAELAPRRRKYGQRIRRSRTKSAGAPWTKERVIEEIQARLREQRPVHAWAVSRDHSGLYSAGRRLIGTWDDALRAAGLDADEHRRRAPKTPSATDPVVSPRKSQGRGDVRLDRGP